MSVQENRKKWLAALRSGEYGQTKDVLCDGEGNYCCLGVLCNTYEVETGNTLPNNYEGTYAVGDETLGDFPQVMEWVGLRDEQGRFKPNELIPSTLLTDLNDGCDWNFHQIADLIESEPEGLFV